ncbi:MAG: TetR/AcrR family transcriptional regulator [Mesorhizobium sp.]|nr:TetR/AcrR family transcriptional regulator [Mesorhizobium sp.]
MAETRSERTQQKILSAASTLFLKDGFSGTSMDEVALAASVSKQTVYAHFRAKEALFVAVVRNMTRQAGDRVQEEVADPPTDRDVEDFLLEFAISQLTIVMTPQLMQLRRLVIAEAERFPELGRALHEQGPGRSIRRLARAFAGYAEAGKLIVPEAQAAAAFFNWLVMGAPVNDAMLLGEGSILDRPAIRAHAEEAVRIFLSAYGARRGSTGP